MKKTKEQSENKTMTIGIPRAFLYYRYRVLWKTFLEELGIRTVVSAPTTRGTLESGTARSVDEACLSSKIYLGHVESLIGRCDKILVPRIAGFGINRCMCTKFEALYDMVANTFYESGQSFLSFDVDVRKGLTEEKAFRQLGETLGARRKEIKAAYKRAKKTEEAAWKAKVAGQEKLLRADGMKVLVAGHSYVLEDAYVGAPVFQYLKQLGVVPVRADVVDRKAALKASERISPTLKWELSREILGGVELYRNRVDGVILVSAFPCGPDSMADEMILRKYPGIPILTLVLDAQSGTAGMETRLESFVDILRFKRGMLA